MLIAYPTLEEAIAGAYELPDDTTPDTLAARAGQIWYRCDVGACTAEAQVIADKVPTECASCGNGLSAGDKYCANCGRVVVRGELPKGWVTSDPDDNPLAGAAQFCGKHASRVPQPVSDAPEPVAEAAP